MNREKEYRCFTVPLYHFGVAIGKFTGSTVAVSPEKALNNLRYQAREAFLKGLCSDWVSSDLTGLDIMDLVVEADVPLPGQEKEDHRGQEMIRLDSGVWVKKEEE